MFSNGKLLFAIRAIPQADSCVTALEINRFDLDCPTFYDLQEVVTDNNNEYNRTHDSQFGTG
jgi:hypothetical protein